MALKGLGRASLAQGRKITKPRHVYLPELDGDGAGRVSAACKTTRHSNCYSLRCTCECHNQCLPVGDDYRCKKVR
jgi:hypothetical protein